MQHEAPSNQGVTVGIYAGGAQTKTTMLSNGLSAAWESGDQIAVWALASSGSYTLSNQTFWTHGIDVSRGFFSSNLAEPMPDGTYTYYACYPAPVSVSGTQGTFVVPAEQDGTAGDGADIMISTPVQHGPLTAIPEPEDHSGMSISMNRMMHQFRFYVPEDDQLLGDEKIKRILLTFPTAVTGNVTLDVADPSVPAQLSEGQTDVVLNLEKPIGVSAGEYQYACLAFVPVQFAEGDSLHIVRAYTDDKIALFDPVDLKGKECLPGHSTPVKLRLRELVDYPFKIVFTVSANNLGEGLNTIRLTAPDGCDWDGTGSNVFEYTPGHKINAGEQIAFYFDYHQESQYRAFSGKDISITYDSDHAVLYETVNIGDAAANNAATISLAVPYLFYENFASVTAYNGDYTAGPYTSVDGAATAARDLSEFGLAGWTGARTGCDAAGTAILVGGRVDCVILGATRAYGRLDSPAMSSLKGNANLKVTFNYSGSRSGSSTYYPVGIFTSTTDSGRLDGYATQFENSEVWGASSYVQIPDIPTGGSAGSMSLSMTSVLEDCNPQTRLSWHVAGMGYKNWKIDNGNQWMYIDNVKVQIAN